MKEKIIVSACLLGEACRYDGKCCPDEKVKKYIKDKEVIAVCPEVMGGLPTPRIPCERVGNKVISKTGIDCTNAYHEGATKVCEIVKEHNVKVALLKSKSPSCGKGRIYDGTFSGNLVEGNGVCVEKLQKLDVLVINSDEIDF